MNHAIRFLVLALIAITLSGCATAPGKKFAGITPPEENQGVVYLYRTSALFYSGGAFDVSLNGEKIGALYNASFLRLQLAPGSYNIKVAPGMMAKTSELVINAEASKIKFYEYDFVTGPLANAFFIGSSIQPRERTQALLDLEKLSGAQ